METGRLLFFETLTEKHNYYRVREVKVS